VLRDWRAVVHAPVGDGQHRRRGSDGMRLAVAVSTAVSCPLAHRWTGVIKEIIDLQIGTAAHA